MDISQEKIDELNAVITVKLRESDYKDNYENALKEARKHMNMPGFRNGKVPVGVVKKKYGKSILAEELNKVLSEKLNDYIKNENLDVLGNPLPKEDEDEVGNWDNPGDFEFKYEVGLAPQFSVKWTKGKYKYHKIKVDNKMLDAHVSDLTKRYGKVGAPEISGANDMLFGDFIEVNENNEIVEGGIMNNSTITVEFIEDGATKTQCTGLKVGDHIIVDPRKVSRSESDMASMLGVIEPANLPAEGVKFQFNVSDIKRLEPAELNQEFYDKVLGEGTVATEEEFRAKVKEDLERMFVRDSDQMFHHDLTDEVLRNLKLKLPDEFLKKWISLSNEKPITPEQLEAEYDGYARNLKWQLVEGKIIKENNIKVEYEEALKFATGMLANQYAQYQMVPPGEKELEESARKVLSNQDEARGIYERIYQQKVLEYLKETVKLNEKEVSYDEFAKLAQAEHDHTH